MQSVDKGEINNQRDVQGVHFSNKKTMFFAGKSEITRSQKSFFDFRKNQKKGEKKFSLVLT